MNHGNPTARLFGGERALTVSSPAIPQHLGRPALVPLRLSGREAINGLFEYRLVMQTPDEVAAVGGLLRGANFSLPDMVGRELCCSIELEGHGSGPLHGQVDADQQRDYASKHAGNRSSSAGCCPSSRVLGRPWTCETWCWALWP